MISKCTVERNLTLALRELHECTPSTHTWLCPLLAVKKGQELKHGTADVCIYRDAFIGADFLLVCLIRLTSLDCCLAH